MAYLGENIPKLGFGLMRLPMKDKEIDVAQTTEMVVKRFEESHPGWTVSIESQGWAEELHTNLRDAYIINKMPDIVVGEAFIQSQIEMDYYAPINDIPAEYLSQVPDFLWAQSRKDGKQYGIPYVTGNFGLVYNAGMFREARYTVDETTSGAPKVPTTVEEMRAAAQAIKDYYTGIAEYTKGGILINNVPGVSSGFRAVTYMTMFGGDFFTDGQLSLNTAANKNAFSYMRNVSANAPQGNAAMNNDNNLILAMFDGKAAMMVDMPSFVLSPSNLTQDLRVAPLPSVSGVLDRRNVLVGSCSFMISKGSKKQKEAKDFLYSLLDKDFQSAQYEAGLLPVRLDVMQELYDNEDNDPAVARTNEYIGSSLFSLMSEEHILGVPSFTNNYTNIWGYWNEFINDVFNTSKDINDITETLQTRIAEKL